MSPQEFWILTDEAIKSAPSYGGMTQREFRGLVEMLEDA